MDRRILPVDDERPIRSILRTVLVARGYDVTEAECGEDALELIASEHFDLVLLDIKLPGITGIEVCRKVRLRNSDLRIVLMSAGEEKKASAYDAGANDYLRKPFGASQIFSCVQRNLSGMALT